MAQMKLVYTTAAKLDSLEIADGQIIYLADENQICLDIRGKRLVYHSIKTFDTDQERLSTDPISKTFYFVFETNILWQYNNGWHQITPSDLQPILYFDLPDDFPSQGEVGKLYYTDDGIYNWRESDNKYHLIANASRWGFYVT